MANDVWLLFNRIRWAVARKGVAMSDEELRALGDEHFRETEDANLQARWIKVKQRSETERRSLEEICDEVVKEEGDPAILLSSPDFTSPQLLASRWITAEVRNRLEAWREQPLKYIQALEELLFSVDDTAREKRGTELHDQMGARSTPYQSAFCAAVMDGIRNRKDSGSKDH